ncbi:MAG: plastocyanin/azurin family copper-binding protein [Sporichthyaceae bacterium]
MRIVCFSAVLAGCLAVSPAVAAATSSSSPPPRQPVAATQQAMAILDFKFAQPKVRLSVGDTMTWTNNDRAPHDVSTTKAPVKLQSPMLMKGDSWKFTFKVPGVYDYICSIHPEMKALVDVAPAAAKLPAAAKKPTTARAAASKPAKAAVATKQAAAKPPATAPEEVAEPAAVPTAEEQAATAEAEKAELLALTSTARELESARQWGAIAVGVALLGLLVVGLQGSSARANAPKPEWVGVGVSQSRHTRRKR